MEFDKEKLAMTNQPISSTHQTTPQNSVNSVNSTVPTMSVTSSATTSIDSNSNRKVKSKKLATLLDLPESNNNTPSSTELFGFYYSARISLDDDPLKWWKEHQHLFPVVARLAKRYLCIPTTSTPAERLFSVGGSVMSSKRHQLAPESIRSLMFLHDNFDLL